MGVDCADLSRIDGWTMYRCRVRGSCYIEFYRVLGCSSGNGLFNGLCKFPRSEKPVSCRLTRQTVMNRAAYGLNAILLPIGFMFISGMVFVCCFQLPPRRLFGSLTHHHRPACKHTMVLSPS